MISSKKPVFLFIHGAWHNANTWDDVIPLLEERGYEAVAIDLPGAGVHAKYPASLHNRDLEPSFATEPSPAANITQDERNEAVIELLHELTSVNGNKAILVGHSMGGLTVSPVAQLVPEKVQAVVYLTAMLVPPGKTSRDVTAHKDMRGDGISLLVADADAVSAIRIDSASQDLDYLAKVKDKFYADLNDDEFKTAFNHLHCDEALSLFGVPSTVTKDRFGLQERHYIRCTQDKAIPITGQDFMISTFDKEMDSQTIVHTLESSHSPFYSQPNALVDILIDVAAP